MSQLTTRESIEQTINNYGWSIDNGDSDGFAACFTDSGELVVDPNTTVTGSAELRNFVAARVAARAPGSIVRHHSTGVTIVKQTDDEARVRSLFLATVLRAEGLSPMATGWYDDELVRDGDTWVIKRRVLHLDVVS
jgi:hypothetical protein